MYYIRCIFDPDRLNHNNSIMNFLKKIKSFAVLMFVCTILVSGSLTSCKPGSDEAKEESEEHPAADSAKADHPKEDAEHPKADSTKVEN